MKNQKNKIQSLILVVCFMATPIISNADLLKRYQGSKQEKSLDAQIKAYRKSAIENMRVFGEMENGPYPLPKFNQKLVKKWHTENPQQPIFTDQSSAQENQQIKKVKLKQTKK
jgi:hypothetical protein